MRINKILVFLMCITLSLCTLNFNSITILADSGEEIDEFKEFLIEEISEYVDTEGIIDIGGYHEVFSPMARATSLIQSVTTSLADYGSGNLHVYAKTNFNQQVTSANISISVQRKVGNSFTTIDNLSASGTNCNSLVYSQIRSYSRNYTYRLYTVHSGKSGSVSDSKTAISTELPLK